MLLDWQPTSTLDNLRLRAKVLKKIRTFFENLSVLEVETPLIGSSTATDPYIQSFETRLDLSGTSVGRFLQTSPEFPMKRLLCAGSGSIYQICKAFRNGEISAKHNPEFTILEWYQVGYTHIELMKEVAEFLRWILDCPPAQWLTYKELFNIYFGINPHTCDIQQLQDISQKYHLSLANTETNKDVWLDLLLTHIIEPELGLNEPIFIYNYPASQAALAKIRKEEDYQVGERFEVYYKSIELANGYHELGDPEEQLQRFNQDNIVRKRQGLPIIPIDHYFLDALGNLPECAGVALGIDRLVCLAANTMNIQDVLTFPSSSS